MTVGFENIYDHITSMDKFRLKWRFTDAKHSVLPDGDLEQLKPLDEDASTFLWNFIDKSRLYPQYFQSIDKASVLPGGEEDTRNWLFQRGVPFGEDVFLSWERTDAMIVPWKVFVKYFDSFYYAEDLMVIDHSLAWSLLFYHEDEIYFGTNPEYKPSEELTNYWFVW